MGRFALALAVCGLLWTSQERNVADCPRAADFRLPADFCSSVFRDSVGGQARHITVSPSGDVYVVLWAFETTAPAGAITALRDTNGDGVADISTRFGTRGGDDIKWIADYLYSSTSDSIDRYSITPGKLTPDTEPLELVQQLPVFDDPEHGARTFAMVGDELWVHVGAPSNACQRVNRELHSPGIDPCPLLKNSGGIWAFSGSTPSTFKDGRRVVTGLRHTRGISLSPQGVPFAVFHGRDVLFANWPERYAEEAAADLPSDEVAVLLDGADYGWPYCYYDSLQGKRVLAPEYGGDGKIAARCATFDRPAVVLPAHSAPNDLLFYTGRTFPGRYRGGAFIALHGGWGRSPLPQNGYQIVYFKPDQGLQPEVFADGFAGVPIVRKPIDAAFRPTGLAQSPDGSLFVLDSRKGRVWKIWFAKNER